MDTRKVLEMGGGTFLISLPKSWARKNGIGRGASVAVEEISPSRLIVHPLERREGEPKEVVIEYPRTSLTYVINDITGAYLIGSNVIHVRGRQTIQREDRDRLKSAITRLIGLEIMDEDSKGMTLQFLPEPSVLDPEKIVRRMGSLVEGMLRDASDGVRQDRRLLTLVGERDDEVDRLYFLLVRSIRTATIDLEIAERYKLAPIECLDYRVLASYLEGVGDTITEFCRRAVNEDLGSEAIAQFVRLFSILVDMSHTAIASFLVKGRTEGNRTYTQMEEMRNKVSEMSKRIVQVRGISADALVDLLSLLERIASIFMDISDLSLPTYQFRQD